MRAAGDLTASGTLVAAACAIESAIALVEPGWDKEYGARMNAIGKVIAERISAAKQGRPPRFAGADKERRNLAEHASFGNGAAVVMGSERDLKRRQRGGRRVRGRGLAAEGGGSEKTSGTEIPSTAASGSERGIQEGGKAVGSVGDSSADGGGFVPDVDPDDGDGEGCDVVGVGGGMGLCSDEIGNADGGGTVPDENADDGDGEGCDVVGVGGGMGRCSDEVGNVVRDEDAGGYVVGQASPAFEAMLAFCAATGLSETEAFEVLAEAGLHSEERKEAG